MAAPNIVNVATINAKTDMFALATTGAITILTNASSSGIVMQVNSIYVSNVDGSANADISIDIHNGVATAGGSSSAAGVGFALASTVVVPADGSLVVLDKNSPVFLEEAMSISAAPSASGDLEVVISYQEIS
tara:strand:+ start:563 stop:958 length:396 start_codon:yes stop_codon:yes gene_type:complete